MSAYRYAEFVGIPDVQPFGCFVLVDRVFRELYRKPLAEPSGPRGIAPLHDALMERGERVEVPQEGDVVLLRCWPWHVGVVTDPGWMLHSERNQASIIERYDSVRWKHRIEGFYRL